MRRPLLALLLFALMLALPAQAGADIAGLSLRSDPPGAGISWNGRPPLAAPFNVFSTVGAPGTVAADPQFVSDGCMWTFDHWSDGGTARHDISMPAGGAALTAVYVKASCELVFAAGRGPAVELTGPRLGARRLGGTVDDADGVASVQVALRRADGRLGCRWWSARAGRLGRTHVACDPARWMSARVQGGRWTADLGGRLPAGRYLLLVRAADRGGAVSEGLADGIPAVPIDV
jgi:hypothetical protein